MPELTTKLGIKKPLGNETVSRAAFNENWDIIDAGVVADKGGAPSIQAGQDASKPAPGTVGRLYVATDTQIIYRDTGSVWAKVGIVKWGDIDEKPSTFPPSVHKTTHTTGGTDALAPADIGAASAADLAAHLADNAAHGAVATATANKIALRDSKGQVVGFVPSARVTHSLAQSIPHNSWTSLSFDSETIDNDAIHDLVTNNSRLTCKTPGKYVIGGSVAWAVNSTGARGVRLLLNGTTPIAMVYDGADTAAPDKVQGIITLYNLNANDYVELQVFQNSGGSLNAANGASFFMVKVGE